MIFDVYFAYHNDIYFDLDLLALGKIIGKASLGHNYFVYQDRSMNIGTIYVVCEKQFCLVLRLEIS